MPKNRTLRWAAALAAAVLGAAALVAARGHDARAQDVAETLLLDNDRVTVYEFLFPPRFRGEEHAAVANEFAYVLDGEASFGANELPARPPQLVVLGPGDEFAVTDAVPGTRFMLMAGKPYGEAPVFNGPYVD